MDIVDRIFQIVDEKGIEQKEFAEQIGTFASTVSTWRKRKAKSYTKYLPQIAEVLDTTVEYLVTGKMVASEDAQEEPESASDKDIKFALFGTADIDDDVYESVKQFAKFAAEQKRGKKTND